MFFCLKVKLSLTTLDKNSDYYNNWGGLKSQGELQFLMNTFNFL